jgi:hypothetical protein
MSLSHRPDDSHPIHSRQPKASLAASTLLTPTQSDPGSAPSNAASALQQASVIKPKFPHAPLSPFTEISNLLLNGLLALANNFRAKSLFGKKDLHMNDYSSLGGALLVKQNTYNQIGGLICRSDIILDDAPLTTEENDILKKNGLMDRGNNLHHFLIKDKIIAYIKKHVAEEYLPALIEGENSLVRAIYSLVDLLTRPIEIQPYEKELAKKLERDPKLSEIDISVNTAKNAINERVANLLAIKGSTTKSQEINQANANIHKAIALINLIYGPKEKFEQMEAENTALRRQLADQNENMRNGLNQIKQDSKSSLLKWIGIGLTLTVGVGLFATGVGALAGLAIFTGCTYTLAISLCALGVMLVANSLNLAFDQVKSAKILQNDIQSLDAVLDADADAESDEEVPAHHNPIQHISALLNSGDETKHERRDSDAESNHSDAGNGLSYVKPRQRLCFLEKNSAVSEKVSSLVAPNKMLPRRNS